MEKINRQRATKGTVIIRKKWRKRKIELLADDYTLFPNIAKEWLNWKKKSS